MKSVVVLFIASLAGFQLAAAAPLDDRSEFFANVDYNQVVSNMKELLMYLPVLMTTVKETMTGFPKVAEGLNTINARRFLLGSGRNNDGRCRCKQIPGDTKIQDDEYR